MTVTIGQGSIEDVPGIRAAGVHAGIKKRREDLGIIAGPAGTTAAAVFTQNAVKAAPVLVSQQHVAKSGGRLRALVVNSGCANACTGPQGLEDATAMTHATAALLAVKPHEVLVASTGIIGRHLPMPNVKDGIRQAAKTLEAPERGSIGRAIMTTDTRPKQVLATVAIGGKTVTVGGIAKGSGMIHPNMGTMLAFVATDAAVPPKDLHAALKEAVADTFNMVSVDGDESTNDMCAVFATGVSGVKLEKGTKAFAAFRETLTAACRELAIQIAADGEGASTLIEVLVKSAKTKQDARAAARAIASSNLVKTAIFGRDPNWGRILAAAGRSGAVFDPAKVSLALGNGVGDVAIVKDGTPLPTFDLHKLSRVLKSDKIRIILDLGAGTSEARGWGCDLSYEYVKVNAEYST